MSGSESVHAAIRRYAVTRRSADVAQCPAMTVGPGFPDNLSQAAMDHLAFCPDCRRVLQRHFTGEVYSETVKEPDWAAMTRRLRRRARWDLLREKIRALMSVPPALAGELQGVAVRGPAPAGIRSSVTIFEINLTELKRLSPKGLRITRLEPRGAAAGMILAMDGFDSRLTGRTVCLGLTRTESILAACRIPERGTDAEPSGIESKLQRMFQSGSPSSTRMEQLMIRTIWVRGVIEMTDTGASVTLVLPPVAGGLVLHPDFRGMLLVG